MHIDPTAAQLAALATTLDEPGPVTMLNLLRLKDRADGVLADEAITGAEAYGRYAAATTPHLARVGARLVWAGQCTRAVIGPDAPEWDLAAIVEYPSRAAFLEMISDAEYLDVSRMRTAALADSRLIPCASVLLGP